MDPHEMVVVRSREAGAEEWGCPSCGRRLLLRWPPSYAKVVLDAGDDRVVHVGGRPAPVTVQLTEHEHRWLGEVGISWE